MSKSIIDYLKEVPDLYPETYTEILVPLSCGRGGEGFASRPKSRLRLAKPLPSQYSPIFRNHQP
jgi:hypothetical protein